MMKKNYVLTTLFTLLFSFIALSQEGNIQGVIIDDNGLKVPFSNILIESLNKGTISDEDGNFLIVDEGVVVQNIEKVVKEELVDPLNEFGNEISNLLLDDTYPLEIKDQLSSSKKMLDDFLINFGGSYNTSS